ncbi:MAG: non-heme iron oxygenase ferredoxin subunit [Patescibacteria group bacterium]
MSQSMKVLTVPELPAGSMKTVTALSKRITIANVGGQYFAVDDMCTHAQCSLGSEGFIDGNVVTCGCHGAQFDMTSGKVMALPATTDLEVYEVTVEGDALMVHI